MMGALVAASCGGGGGGSRPGREVVSGWSSAFLSAVVNERSSELSGLVSNTYLQSCTNKTQLLAEYQDIFNRATSIQASYNLRSWNVNTTTGRASFRGTLQITATGPSGYSYSESTVIERFLVREAGVWREVGNQLCP